LNYYKSQFIHTIETSRCLVLGYLYICYKTFLTYETSTIQNLKWVLYSWKKVVCLRRYLQLYC